MTNQPVSSTRLSYTVLNTWLFSWGQYFHDFAGDQLDRNNFYQRKNYSRVTVQEWINRWRPGNSNASKCSEGPRNEARSGCVFTPVFNTCILLLELIIHTLLSPSSYNSRDEQRLYNSREEQRLCLRLSRN